MQPFYQKYGVQVDDPSKGLTAGLAANKVNLTDLVGNIKSMMENQEGQIIKANTQQATDMLKQKIQQRGLGVLAAPIDQELDLRPFGNMVDRKAIGEVVKNQTELIKNQFTNQASAEADAIFSKTGDPIAARNHYNKTLIAAGAPSTFADESSVAYDTRKAADIKNQDILHQRVVDVGLARAGEVASQGGYTVALDDLRNNIKNSNLPDYKKAALTKDAIAKFNDAAKINEHDAGMIANEMASFDQGFKAELDSRMTNLHDKNAQTYTNSNSSSASNGVEGGSRSRKKDRSGGAIGPDLIDSKGTVNSSVAVGLGKHVTNFVERLSRTSDSAMIKAIHKDVADAVGDEGVAGNILGQAFSYAYQGDGMLGNNLSAKDIEAMKKKATELVQAHNGKDTGTSSSSSSRSNSSSRGGNISFTNADGINSWINEKNKERSAFYEKLTTAARDNALGFKGNADPNNPVVPNRLEQEVAAFRNRQTITPATPTGTTVLNAPTTGKPVAGKVVGRGNTLRPSDGPINPDYDKESPVGPPGSNGRVAAAFKENGWKEVPRDVSKSKTGKSGKESPDDAVTRKLAVIKEREAKAKGVAPQATAVTPDTSTLTPQQRYEQEMVNITNRRKLQNNPPGVVKAKGKADPHEGQVQVIDPKYGKVWVKKDIAKLRYGYKG